MREKALTTLLFADREVTTRLTFKSQHVTLELSSEQGKGTAFETRTGGVWKKKQVTAIAKTMNFAIDQRMSSDDPVESHLDGDQDMMDCQSSGMAETDSASPPDATASFSRTEPERGVKKTASLRRGGAVYDQLLQSAVMASIAGGKEAIMDDSPAFPPPSSPGAGMETSGPDSVEQSSPGKKKRTASYQLGQSGLGSPRSKSQKNLFPTTGVMAGPPNYQR